MSDISKIKLPDGNTYDIKDTVARSQGGGTKVYDLLRINFTGTMGSTSTFTFTSATFDGKTYTTREALRLALNQYATDYSLTAFKIYATFNAGATITSTQTYIRVKDSASGYFQLTNANAKTGVAYTCNTYNASTIPTGNVTWTEINPAFINPLFFANSDFEFVGDVLKLRPIEVDIPPIVKIYEAGLHAIANTSDYDTMFAISIYNNDETVDMTNDDVYIILKYVGATSYHNYIACSAHQSVFNNVRYNWGNLPPTKTSYDGMVTLDFSNYLPASTTLGTFILHKYPNSTTFTVISYEADYYESLHMARYNSTFTPKYDLRSGSTTLTITKESGCYVMGDMIGVSFTTNDSNINNADRVFLNVINSNMNNRYTPIAIYSPFSDEIDQIVARVYLDNNAYMLNKISSLQNDTQYILVFKRDIPVIDRHAFYGYNPNAV